MSRKLISIACEGPHDVAFLNRILKAHGYQTDERLKIGDYPEPMGKFFQIAAKKVDFQQLNFSEIRQISLPSHALVKNSISVFLYALGGDSKKEERKSLLTRLFSFIPKDPQELSALPAETTLGMLFMIDADSVGVGARLETMKTEIADTLSIDLDRVSLSSNGECCTIDGLVTGCLVLTDGRSDKGKLEDVLIPMMRTGNEAIFEDAERFLASHFQEERTMFLRIRVSNGQLTENRGNDKDFDRKKSLIGVVAQLQISGKPNQACINRTDYLNREKLVTAAHCAPIRDFIMRMEQI